jgi:hypothetical protein
MKNASDIQDGDLWHSRNLYIVLPGHYHAISDRYTQTPIASTRLSSHPKTQTPMNQA